VTVKKKTRFHLQLLSVTRLTAISTAVRHNR